MAAIRAGITAAVLFAGVCLTLGTLGAVMLQDGRVLAVYGAAVVGFATWVALERVADARRHYRGRAAARSSRP